MQAFNHKRKLPLKRRNRQLVYHILTSGYRPGDEWRSRKGLALLTLWYQKAQELGDKVRYAIQNMAMRGVSYIIWKQRFYAPIDSKYGPQLILGTQCQTVVA